MNLKENKLFFALPVIAFSSGFFLTYGRTSDNAADKDNAHVTAAFTQSGNNPALPAPPANTISGPDESNLSRLAQKLKENLTSEDCEQLFEELLSEPNALDWSNMKMSMLLRKWGTLAPRQALEKLKNANAITYWPGCVFGAWAAKDPETAVAFYEQSQDTHIKNDTLLPYFLTGGWAEHDPQKCWDWIQNQKGKKLSDDSVLSCQESVIHSLISKHPEKLSDFLDKNEYYNWQFPASSYALGEKILSQSETAPEWLEKLPEQARLRAEAGRLMAVSKGDLPEIAACLSKMDAEKQKKLLKELLDPILEASRLDIRDRVNWFVDNFPEESFPEQLPIHINSWMLQDDSAKPWVDALPPGRKKDLLLKLYNPKPDSMIIRQ